MKIDKKVLIILTIVLAIILVVGFFVYNGLSNANPKVENSTGGANAENPAEGQGNNSPQVQIEPGAVQVQGGNPSGGLTVCMDKCGDGICQVTDPACKDNSTCICLETNLDCPQDCK